MYSWDRLKKFLGRRIIFWMAFGILAGIGLGYIEMFIAFSIQVILKHMYAPAAAGRGMLMGPSLPPVMAGALDSLGACIWFFIGLVILKLTLGFLIVLGGTTSYVLMGARLRVCVFYKLLQRDKPRFLAASDIHFQMVEVAQKAAAFCNQQTSTISNGVQMVTLAAILFWMSWPLALFCMAGIAVVAAGLFWINKVLRDASAGVPKKMIWIYKTVQRIARNWLLVYVCRTNTREYEGLVDAEVRFRNLDLKIAFLNFLSDMLPQTVGAILLIAVIFLNARTGHVSPGALLAFLYILIRFSSTIGLVARSVATAVTQYPQFKIAYDGFFEMPAADMRAASEATRLISFFHPGKVYRSAAGAHHDTLPETASSPAISFENVVFAYENSRGPVIRDMTFAIEPGQQVGIIGASGSGKTTILGLVLGLLFPVKGQVKINGQESEVFFKNNRLKVGYVGAEPFLIEGTLKDNLFYGHDREDITPQQISEALRLARADDFVAHLPQGLEYRISENGDGLSAGQKQRLALARALLGRPKLLVLDEVSANLDIDNESQIARSLSDLKGVCTTIIVSHKPGMVRYAQQLIDLNATAVTPVAPVKQFAGED